MNGEPLPLDHGYPLRFFVPGFGANANVKWLGRLTITKAQPDFSPTQKNEIIVGPDYPAQGLTPALQNPKSCFELFAPRATRARDRERRLGAIPLAGTIVQRVVAGTVPKRTETQLVGALLLQLAGSRTGLLPDRQPRVRRARTSAAAGRHVPSPGSRPTGPARRYRRTERAAGAEHITLAFRIACGTLVLLQLHAFRQVKGRAR